MGSAPGGVSEEGEGFAEPVSATANMCALPPHIVVCSIHDSPPLVIVDG